MRVLASAYRRQRRIRRGRGRVVTCAMVRNDAYVAALRPHTKTYNADARTRLGVAVTRAREAAGHSYRPSFAALAGISVASLFKLESGKPVGASVYEAVARVLPGWTEDTPRTILEGGPVPPTETAVDGQVEDVHWEAYRERLRAAYDRGADAFLVEALAIRDELKQQRDIEQ